MEFDAAEEQQKKMKKSKSSKPGVMADLSSIQNNDDDIINLNFVRKNVNKSDNFKAGSLEDPGKVYGTSQKKSKKSIDSSKILGGAKRDS